MVGLPKISQLLNGMFCSIPTASIVYVTSPVFGVPVIDSVLLPPAKYAEYPRPSSMLPAERTTHPACSGQNVLITAQDPTE